MHSCYSDWAFLSRVPPFGHLRLAGYVLLTAAFRSLSRPSSAPGAKASSLRSSSLDHQFGVLFPSPSVSVFAHRTEQERFAFLQVTLFPPNHFLKWSSFSQKNYYQFSLFYSFGKIEFSMSPSSLRDRLLWSVSSTDQYSVFFLISRLSTAHVSQHGSFACDMQFSRYNQFDFSNWTRSSASCGLLFRYSKEQLWKPNSITSKIVSHVCEFL